MGSNLSLEPTMQRVTTLFLTWVFYAPAIALLALSGYRWTVRLAGQGLGRSQKEDGAIP